ncbi:MAG: hypothetical protein ACR2PH_04835, partial [Desulfobulbia bacterium]
VTIELGCFFHVGNGYPNVGECPWIVTNSISPEMKPNALGCGGWRSQTSSERKRTVAPTG